MIINVRVQRTPSAKRVYISQPAGRREYARQRELGNALTTNPTRRGDTSHIKSNNDWLTGPAPDLSPKTDNVYSGEALLGVATMHKSNAVPVTREAGGMGTNPKIQAGGIKQTSGININPRSATCGKRVTTK